MSELDDVLNLVVDDLDFEMDIPSDKSKNKGGRPKNTVNLSWNERTTKEQKARYLNQRAIAKKMKRQAQKIVMLKEQLELKVVTQASTHLLTPPEKKVQYVKEIVGMVLSPSVESGEQLYCHFHCLLALVHAFSTILCLGIVDSIYGQVKALREAHRIAGRRNNGKSFTNALNKVIHVQVITRS